ncbi:hypothetical protein H072_4180 [Dactylellina haptotyla CBS 200.50]|uniref:Uncharacterized protein n=1 Tax=Dactylellina haptotyla (strain CBS 200.50) TaxID=1284197 RepID=S8BR13_DACHA|nr:hypothetical protein H072_4180 [Dactylellina haptotyla CBS 200.50]
MIDRTTYTTTYIYLLLILSTNFPGTHAYFSLMAREIRPNWFKSFNYFFTSVELNEREPDVCYQTVGRSVWGDIEWVAFYNKLDETPISSVGLYNNRRCGNTNTHRRRRPQQMPMAVLVFDPHNLHGIHLVNLKALGIHWNRGAFVSLNLTEEVKQQTRNGSTGVFSQIPGSPAHGVYVWEGDPAIPKNLGRNVVYLPNAVQHLAEPTDLLQRIYVGSDQFGYVYMRDLIERALVGPERAAQIPDTVTP